jgi:DNA repair protein RadC
MSNLKTTTQLLPREKLLKFGAQNLKTHELLAILLSTGTKDMNVLELSKSILKKFPIETLWDIRLDDLNSIKGLSNAKSMKILAAVELAKTLAKEHQPGKIQITSTETVAAICNDLQNKTKEHFAVLYLDAGNYLIHKEVLSVGILNSTLIHPREVFEPALRLLSAYIILVHNHPSGEIVPSEEDVIVTKNLKAAGDILGIEVIDHVIVGGGKFQSIIALCS